MSKTMTMMERDIAIFQNTLNMWTMKVGSILKSNNIDLDTNDNLMTRMTKLFENVLEIPEIDYSFWGYFIHYNNEVASGTISVSPIGEVYLNSQLATNVAQTVVSGVKHLTFDIDGTSYDVTSSNDGSTLTLNGDEYDYDEENGREVMCYLASTEDDSETTEESETDEESET